RISITRRWFLRHAVDSNGLSPFATLKLPMYGNRFMKLHGIVPPVVTPMYANEDVDRPRLRAAIDRLLAARVHGIFVLGTTGEFYALDSGENQAIIAESMAHVRRRLPVIAGTGAQTTREAVRLTQMAEREKADAVTIITPYFVQPTQQELFDHFRRV